MKKTLQLLKQLLCARSGSVYNWLDWCCVYTSFPMTFPPSHCIFKVYLCDSVYVYVCVECMGGLVGEIWGPFLENL